MGLYAFFYGMLHFTTYVVLDRFAGLVEFPDGIVSWTTVRNLLKSIGGDIYQRPFITIGFTALVLMVPLAITSTAGMIRRLGGRRWNQLHRLVYVTAILRRDPLLVAREGRHPPAADVRGDRGHPAGISARQESSRNRAGASPSEPPCSR